MNPKPIFVTNEVARILGPSLGRQSGFQTYAGTDIQAIIYVQSDTRAAANNQPTVKSKVFADLQTMSISSTRSVSPVRVFGRSSPLTYTRGARTFAGTMVFASINQDAFADLYDHSMAESTMASSTSIVSDQLPPFSVLINAVNEKGGAAIHVVQGITLVNYGTTYSVDDLYTETTYSYVATDVYPLMATTLSLARAKVDQLIRKSGYPNVTDLVQKNIGKAYGSSEDLMRYSKKTQNSGGLPEQGLRTE